MNGRYADVKNGNALEMIYKNKESLGLKRGEDIMQLGRIDKISQFFLFFEKVFSSKILIVYESFTVAGIACKIGL